MPIFYIAPIESSGDKAIGNAVEYKLRPEVAAFAALMEAGLRKHDDRPGWKECDIDWLMQRLREEANELGLAIFSNDASIPKEAADVANFAMMIADVRGGLNTTPAPTIKKDVTVGPSIPERIKELMVYVAHWQTTRDMKKFPWTEEDKKAFGEVLRILQCSLPAPLPEKVEEAIKRASRAFDIKALYYRACRDTTKYELAECRDKDEAALAVIKAALRPKVVSREWVLLKSAELLGQLFVRVHPTVDAITKKWINDLLHEKGIGVEEKP